MSTHYRHLITDDRIEFQHLLEQGHTQAEIARRLGVHRSTISRERKRGLWHPEDDHANLRPYLRNKLDSRDRHEGIYLAGQAQLQADTRKQRSHQPYRMRYDRLVDWVISQLRRGWTPEEISGRLPIEFPYDSRMRVSTETLYAWIYNPEEAHRQLWQYLPRGQKKRRRLTGRRVHAERIKYRVSIHDRPAEVNDRSGFGHWESDSVLGARDTGGIHTSVERKSRYLVGVKIPQVTAQAKLNAQLAIYQGMPARAVCSITADNGGVFCQI
ncbi:MAG TPA: IS30 family transposase [Microbacteriaceae bacterium]|nr:IS30 family transposase [Microbacteriaceae bacterium]